MLVWLLSVFLLSRDDEVSTPDCPNNSGDADLTAEPEAENLEVWDEEPPRPRNVDPDKALSCFAYRAASFES